VPEPTPLAVRGFFARLRERGFSLSRQHQACRAIKTFFRRWHPGPASSGGRVVA
jgi:hypothetical protein